MCFKTGGSAPNAPEVLRFGSTCKEMRLGKGNILHAPHFLQQKPTERSGCSSALPYPLQVGKSYL